jgi:phosphoglycolate phosphatase
MIQAVLVDFDDTLCPTEEAGFAFENEVLRRLGRPPQTREIHKATWGQPMLAAMPIRSPGVDVVQFHTIVHDLFPQWAAEGKIDAIPPVNLRTLDMLRRDGMQIYVVTSRIEDELRHILTPDHILMQRLEAIYYHETLMYHKPDPRTFDKVLALHQLRPSECVYVGDSPSDAAAAKQAGLYFIASLESHLRRQEDFEPWGADSFITRFSDVPKAIQLLGNAQSGLRLNKAPAI